MVRDEATTSIIMSGLSLFVCLFVCLSVCVFAFHAQTIWPIVFELGMGPEGHLAGNIGLVSCAWVYGVLCEKGFCVFASQAQTV